MKTIKNRSRHARTLARTWDEDSGEYSYFFLTAKGMHRYQVVTVKDGTFDAGCWYASQVRKGLMPGKFSFRESDMNGVDLWRHELSAGESISVPTHRETYHQMAMRTGEFRPSLNRCFAAIS